MALLVQRIYAARVSLFSQRAGGSLEPVAIKPLALEGVFPQEGGVFLGGSPDSPLIYDPTLTQAESNFTKDPGRVFQVAAPQTDRLLLLTDATQRSLLIEDPASQKLERALRAYVGSVITVEPTATTPNKIPTTYTIASISQLTYGAPLLTGDPGSRTRPRAPTTYDFSPPFRVVETQSAGSAWPAAHRIAGGVLVGLDTTPKAFTDGIDSFTTPKNIRISSGIVRSAERYTVVVRGELDRDGYRPIEPNPQDVGLGVVYYGENAFEPSWGFAIPSQVGFLTAGSANQADTHPGSVGTGYFKVREFSVVPATDGLTLAGGVLSSNPLPVRERAAGILSGFDPQTLQNRNIVRLSGGTPEDNAKVWRIRSLEAIDHRSCFITLENRLQ